MTNEMDMNEKERKVSTEFVRSVHKNMYVYNKDIEPDDLMMNIKAGMIGEFGEVVDCLKKIVFHNNNKNYNVTNISLEIGDVLWYLTAYEIHNAKYVNGSVLEEIYWIDDVVERVIEFSFCNDEAERKLDSIFGEFLSNNSTNKKINDTLYMRCKCLLSILVSANDEIISLNMIDTGKFVVALFPALFDKKPTELMTQNMEKLSNRFKNSNNTLQPVPNRDSW